METSLNFTDAWASLLSLIKADVDVINVPRKAITVTFANRSTKKVYLKRTQSASSPLVSEGFRLDAELNGIWYITLQNVDLSTTFIKAVDSGATGEVDVSLEF